MSHIGPFGGDLRYSHFAVQAKDAPGRWNGTKEERLAAREIDRANDAKLKEHGIKTRYFQYRTADTKAKAKQKAAADSWAKQVENQTGIKMAVHEGFFM
jgi:hypothetical protein